QRCAQAYQHISTAAGRTTLASAFQAQQAAAQHGKNQAQEQGSHIQLAQIGDPVAHSFFASLSGSKGQRDLVATMLTSVPRIFPASTWPTLTGDLADRLLISCMQSNIFSLGSGRSVLTGSRAMSAPSIFTVEVMTRTGCSISFLPYSAPRGQALPVTL